MSSRFSLEPFWVQTHYVLRSVLKELVQRPAATFLTLLVISVSLTLPTISYLLWKNANQAIKQFSPASEMTLYLHNILSEKDSQLVVKNIRQQKGVADVIYISRQQSLENFRSWSGFHDELDALEENPLPAVVIVQLDSDYQSPQKRNYLHDELIKIKGVQEVQLDNDWLDKLAALEGLSSRISVAASLLMFLTLLLVISNSIRADVYNRQDKIEVMQLLGATDQFILRPFIYTGLIYMLISGLLTLLFSYVLTNYFSLAIQQLMDIFTITFQVQGFDLGEFVFFMVFCLALGYLIARMAAIRHIRFLERKNRNK
ncbi:cell division protein FtsX [[Haemophilus] felis]|nr:cell division protein FtsX [[Haemophilus] felis]